jgi:IPT/TIG domain-containing protein
MISVRLANMISILVSTLISICLFNVFIPYLNVAIANLFIVDSYAASIHHDMQHDVILMDASFIPSSIAKIGGEAKLQVRILTRASMPKSLVAKVRILRIGQEPVSLASYNQNMEIPLVPGEITSALSDLISTSPENTFMGDIGFRVSFIDIGKPGKEGRFESFVGGDRSHDIKVFPEIGQRVWLSIQSIHPRPNITSISVTPSNNGRRLEIIGSNFGDEKGNSVVTIDDVNIYINEWSNNKIIATIRSDIMSGNVVVIVMDQRSNEVAL